MVLIGSDATRTIPYLIFYLEQTDRLDVQRVLHAHRDIPVSLQDTATDT